MGRTISLGLLALISLTGCQSYLQPLDNSPIPVHQPLEAAGGGTITKDAKGRLILRPSCGNFESSWGVSLEERGGAVHVVARVSPTATLESGDVLLSVRTRRFLESAPGSLGKPKGAKRQVQRALRRGRMVDTLQDLHGYDRAWALLELVVRRGGEAVVIEHEVGRPQVLPVTSWEREHAGPLGVELTRIDTWPAEWRPKKAAPSDLLVVHVGVDSPFGHGGVRPLDLLQTTDYEGATGEDPEEARERLDDFDWEDLSDSRMMWVRNDDQAHLLPKWGAAGDTELPFAPGLLEVESDGTRTHVGMGPLDALFHYNSLKLYDARRDGYDTRWRWSLFTVFALQGWTEGDELYLGRTELFTPVDPVRVFYFADRLLGPGWSD